MTKSAGSSSTTERFQDPSDKFSSSTSPPPPGVSSQTLNKMNGWFPGKMTCIAYPLRINCPTMNQVWTNRVHPTCFTTQIPYSAPPLFTYTVSSHYSSTITQNTKVNPPTKQPTWTNSKAWPAKWAAAAAANRSPRPVVNSRTTSTRVSCCLNSHLSLSLSICNSYSYRKE